MTDVFKTALVEKSIRQTVSDACELIEGGQSMFRREVLVDSVVEYYISSGWADEEIWNTAEANGAIVEDAPAATVIASVGGVLGDWWTPPEE